MQENSNYAMTSLDKISNGVRKTRDFYACSIAPFYYQWLVEINLLYYKLEQSSAPVKDNQVFPSEEDPAQKLTGEEINSIRKLGNLAFQKPIPVSSTELAYRNYAERVVDGDSKTRWSSEWQIDSSWITIDLEINTIINRVHLSWEWLYAKEYEIQISDDRENWLTVYTDTEKGNEEDLRSLLWKRGMYAFIVSSVLYNVFIHFMKYLCAMRMLLAF